MLKELLKKSLRNLGVVRRSSGTQYPPDFAPEHIAIVEAVKPYTMTSLERLFAVIEATRYVALNKIPGSIVECGVWRGGSMMAAALALRGLESTDRDLYLFDTYDGMPLPKSEDVDFKGRTALSEFERTQTPGGGSNFCLADVADVRASMKQTKYDLERVHYVKGRVEQTIPSHAPDHIAVLRLDTDWYESTRHELEHLYPRLSPGGVLIIDDYGHWKGSRKATDEYFSGHSIFLNRIDYTGRLIIKPAQEMAPSPCSDSAKLSRGVKHQR